MSKTSVIESAVIVCFIALHAAIVTVSVTVDVYLLDWKRYAYHVVMILSIPQGIVLIGSGEVTAVFAETAAMNFHTIHWMSSMMMQYSNLDASQVRVGPKFAVPVMIRSLRREAVCMSEM